MRLWWLGRFLLIGGVVLAALVGLLAYWSAPCVEPSPSPIQVWQVGEKAADKLSLIGIQPYMTPMDYACEETFSAKLRSYMEGVRQAIHAGSVVVFPEYVGTWLILLGESRQTYQAATLQGALTWFVLRRPWDFWKRRRAAQKEGWQDPDAVATFRIKAPLMAQVYHRTFSQLAATYRAVIVAGSIVLPGAQIIGDSLVVSLEAPLENVSLIYNWDGKPLGLTRKVYPIATELAFTRPAPADSLRPYNLEGTQMAVLICADSWYPDCYESIGKADLWVVPSYLMGNACWNKPWRGYSGWPAPSDVRDTSLTEGQAWQAYALGGRLLHRHRQAVGLNVFLQGRLWELGADGRALAVLNDTLYEAPPASVIVMWYPSPTPKALMR